MSSVVPVFIGWPNEGIEYWNGYWRHQAALGFFDDIQDHRLEKGKHGYESRSSCK